MNSLLKKTLALILVTLILSAVLTALVFRVTGTKAYAEIKLEELLPRAYFLADRTGEFFQGFISQQEYEATINSDRRIWDAELYVYSASGQLVIYSTHGDIENNTQLIEKRLPEVLEGQPLSAFTLKKGSGVIVGAPVFDIYGAVIGAAFLVKPLQELSATLGSLLWALIIAMLLSMVIMILPSYFASRKLTGPLETMNAAALAMAQGNFTIKAGEKGGDEIAQLGHSLNLLSGALSATIGELTFERNRLRSVLYGLGEGVVAVNSGGEVMQFNPAALTLMGGERARPEEGGLYGSIAPEIGKVLAGKEETVVVERARRDRTLRFTLNALRDDTGAIEGALILVQDVTEAARLEQTRRDYVANVSHELRTPLASIRSLSDALCDGLVKKDQDRLRYYGYIQKETIRLSRLIDDLLELSRLQSGAVALTKQRMKVDELLLDVAGRYGKIASERGFSIDLELPGDCPEAYGNPDRTEQVLIALIDNAIKHNEGGGNVLLRAGGG
ncbi:MAG TPA: histidine kinase dimerization/phospho-acceptor domain-containing protein, partial [Clostridia bacterium]|nr:histidine kinase dimerization/phospho-acceptor domain-containing protein [Clostridia bacterium]